MSAENGYTKKLRKIIGERSKAVHRERRAKGERISEIAPLGYFYQGGKMLPHLLEQWIIRKILKLRKQGLGYRMICRKLANKGIPCRTTDRWCHTTIASILRRAGVK